MAYNALLYSGKDTATQGMTMWYRWDTELAVVAYDDYFAIHDAVEGLEICSEVETFVFLPLAELQTLEKSLRDAEGGVTLGSIPFVDPGETLPPGRFALQDVEDKVWGLENGELTEAKTDAPFAVNPDRLRRLSLLKPKNYPLDFQMVYDTDQDVNLLLFKYGPTCRGAISLLNRGILESKFREGELW